MWYVLFYYGILIVIGLNAFFVITYILIYLPFLTSIFEYFQILLSLFGVSLFLCRV